MRGWTVPDGGPPEEGEVSPACARMDREFSEAIQGPVGLARVRADGPLSSMERSVLDMSHPRTRGWTARETVVSIAANVSTRVCADGPARTEAGAKAEGSHPRTRGWTDATLEAAVERICLTIPPAYAQMDRRAR